MSAPLDPLFVRTVRVPHPVDLLRRIPPHVTAAWLHEGRGMIARGAAAHVPTRGAERFAEASLMLREVAASARVRDDVGARGTGMVALGSFSYSASSRRVSELVIPSTLLGVGEQGAYLTLARFGAPPPEPGPEEWSRLFPLTDGGEEDAPDRVELEPDHTPDEYQGLVDACVRRLREDGTLRKVVLSETSTARTAVPVRPAVLLARLARRYPSTWVFLAGDVIGASPEMLAETEGGRVHSRVLAGTRPAVREDGLGAEERAAFLADPKERSEHAYAVDSVAERLAEVAEDVRAPEEPFVLRLPGLEHLASDVRARLRPRTTSLDAVAALHPSAAVSGTPREEADALIASLEAHDRGGYAAPVGWVDAAGDGQWAIALRMAHLRGPRELRLQAGGGLVAASDPVIEHAEVLAKMRPVLGALRGSEGA